MKLMPTALKVLQRSNKSSAALLLPQAFGHILEILYQEFIALVGSLYICCGRLAK